jgi:type VI protein secretion system component VasA
MNQQEFKEEIFENREAIKEKFGNIYDSKKLLQMFFTIFEKIDFLTFSKLPTNEQQALVEKVFGSPELVFGKVAREELVNASNLASKRKKTKSRE